jgi:uncharacterized integral membrane protein (TIGR00698 family)
MIVNQNTTFNKIFFFGIIVLISLSSTLPFLNWITSWISLVLGIVFAIILGNPYDGKTGNLTSSLLKISVVGIGFGYPISAISELSITEFSFVIIFIFLTLILGFIIGKIINVDRKIADLITAGTSICGASAIAAVASTIKANEKQISISLGTVFILSASGLIIYPIIGNYLDLTQHQFGIWAGLSVHDTASAIGAAQDFGPEALKTATIVKLAKVLFIVPLVFLGSYLYKDGNKKISFPFFIVFFLLAMFLNSIFPEFIGFGTIKEIGKKGLQISLFLIGANLSIKNLKTIGIKPFLQGFLLWLLISLTSLLAILSF